MGGRHVGGWAGGLFGCTCGLDVYKGGGLLTLLLLCVCVCVAVAVPLRLGCGQVAEFAQLSLAKSFQVRGGRSPAGGGGGADGKKSVPAPSPALMPPLGSSLEEDGPRLSMGLGELADCSSSTCFY